MIGFVGWTTATTRDSGNLSSRCRYNTGARLRASIAPLSDRASAPCKSMGRIGMWARGPHPIDVAMRRARAVAHTFFPLPCRIRATPTVRPMLPDVAWEHEPPEDQCVSLVQIRTTPRKYFTLSTATAQAYRSVVHPVLAQSSVTRSDILPCLCRM